MRTDHHSLKWPKTINRPEGILATGVETLAVFDLEKEHRSGRFHSNVDGVSRQYCKQCDAKPTNTKWFDELDRANELVEPLAVHTVTQIPQVNAITMAPESSVSEIAELQARIQISAQFLTGSSHLTSSFAQGALRLAIYGHSAAPSNFSMDCFSEKKKIIQSNL